MRRKTIEGMYGLDGCIHERQPREIQRIGDWIEQKDGSFEHEDGTAWVSVDGMNDVVISFVRARDYLKAPVDVVKAVIANHEGRSAPDRFEAVRLDPEGWTVLAPPIMLQDVVVRLRVEGHPPGEVGARAVAAALNAAIGASP